MVCVFEWDSDEYFDGFSKSMIAFADDLFLFDFYTRNSFAIDFISACVCFFFRSDDAMLIL